MRSSLSQCRSSLIILIKDLNRKPRICGKCYQLAKWYKIWRKGSRWNPLAWYNLMLDKYPIRTKMITSGVLYGVGDILAQKGTRPNDSFDIRRCVRASIFGFVFMGPLAHYHFAFLERLVVTKYPLRAAVMPFAETAIDQFTYWTPCILTLYHTSIGAMEGLGFNEIKERLRLLLWPSMKANWMLWPAVQLINFKFVPVPHQLNLCLNSCWPGLGNILELSGEHSGSQENR